MGECRIDLEQLGQDRAGLERPGEERAQKGLFAVFVKAFFAFFSQPYFGAATRGCVGLLAEHRAEFCYQVKPPLTFIVVVDSMPVTASDNLFFKQSHLVIVGKCSLVIWR